jgi:hypothetical protein
MTTYPYKRLSFYMSCVGCPRHLVDDLINMIDANIAITYNTFIKHVDRDELREMEKAMGYDTMPWERRGLRLKNDWAVSYHRSTFKGKQVYYFRHSGIEYLFA